MVHPQQSSYGEGGFKLYDISNREKPKLIAHHRTHGRGVHRFDMDERYAYISTEMEGYVGNILVIYDIRNPARPEEVSRWWMPGQHVAGGEKPTWVGRRNRPAPRAALRRRALGGLLARRRARDRRLRHPQAAHARRVQLPPALPRARRTPSCRCPRRIGGRRIAVAIDEEDHAHSAEEMERRRGRPHGCLWVFDVTDLEEHQAARRSSK